MKKNKTITIFDTTFTDYEYEDYVAYCEFAGVEPQGENSADFYQWCMEETSNNTECDWDNLKYSKADKENYPFFITGVLGLWNGKPVCHSTRIFYGLSEAIKSTISNSNIMDYKVYCENGVVNVEAMHHDGTNCFEIHLLSKKGLTAIQRMIDSGKINEYDLEFKPEWWKKLKAEDIWG